MSTRETLPARLRQATDNYELLPAVSFAEWVHRIQVLCDEAADALSPSKNPTWHRPWQSPISR